MLTRRIIPCLDVLDGHVVKGIHFKGLKRTGAPDMLAEAYAQQGADEIVFLDIGAAPEARNIMVDVVRKTARRIFIPLTVGGGIRGLDDFERILKAGADKVSVNTAAVKNPKLIREAAERFGCQCVVAAIDAKKQAESNWEVFVVGGRIPTGKDALHWAKQVENLGAGEILLTSMDADGTQSGYDLELTRAVSESVNIPIIASGGAGSPEHIYDVLTKGKADAALAASIFHYEKMTVLDVKGYLAKRAVPVRIP